jgi:hypothetical protein
MSTIVVGKKMEEIMVEGPMVTVVKDPEIETVSVLAGCVDVNVKSRVVVSKMEISTVKVLAGCVEVTVKSRVAVSVKEISRVVSEMIVSVEAGSVVVKLRSTVEREVVVAVVVMYEVKLSEMYRISVSTVVYELVSVTVL